VQIERVGVASAYGAGLQRLGQWPTFARQVFIRLQTKHDRGDWDAVHCHDLDTLPIGYAYSRRPTGRKGKRVRLLFDAHESYPDLVAPHMPRWAVWGLGMTERFLVRHVDAVITVGDLLADRYRPWAPRVTVVRNCPAHTPMRTTSKGSNDLIGRSTAQRNGLRRAWGLDNVGLVVCYIGGLTLGRLILPLVAAVRADPSLGLVLVGDGPQLPSLLAAAEGVGRIAYLGKQVPRDQIVNIMGAADVVYYGLRSDFPNNHFSSPNALYSALAAGCPLLTTDVGEISRIVRSERCGIVFESSNDLSRSVEAIETALRALRAPDVRTTMSRNALRAAETKYNWPAAKAELLSLYRVLWGEV
jgi:glycosyltransferase involved in cell wall biosynthesis